MEQTYFFDVVWIGELFSWSHDDKEGLPIGSVAPTKPDW
jgi:hypothetical protein